MNFICRTIKKYNSIVRVVLEIVFRFWKSNRKMVFFPIKYSHFNNHVPKNASLKTYILIPLLLCTLSLSKSKYICKSESVKIFIRLFQTLIQVIWVIDTFQSSVSIYDGLCFQISILGLGVRFDYEKCKHSIQNFKNSSQKYNEEIKIYLHQKSMHTLLCMFFMTLNLMYKCRYQYI